MSPRRVAPAVTAPGRTRRGLSRRALLNGALGGLAALPLLQSLAARAQSEAQFPLRLLLVFHPNGVIQETFWPTRMDSGGEADFAMSQMLSALEPHRDKLLVLEGLDLSVTSIGPGGPHQRGVGGLFTGAELQEGSFLSGDGRFAGWANGRSIDQHIAQTLQPDTFLPSLELGVRSLASEVRSRIVYADPAKPIPPENDPARVYERVFGGLVTDDAVREQQTAMRRMALGAASEQYGLIKTRLSSEDGQKVEQHLEQLLDIERRLDVHVQIGAGCQVPEAPPLDLDIDSEETMPEVARLQMDLLAMALACDATRLGSLQFSDAINAIRFPWIGSMREGHSLSHMPVSDTEALSERITRNVWYAEQFAYLLAALDSIPEGEGTVLDNTLIIWGSEVSVGNTHTLTNMPFVLAGGAGGQLNTGRFLSYSGVAHNQLLVSALNLMGVETEHYGHPDMPGGALPGLTV